MAHRLSGCELAEFPSLARSADVLRLKFVIDGKVRGAPADSRFLVASLLGITTVGNVWWFDEERCSGRVQEMVYEVVPGFVAVVHRAMELGGDLAPSAAGLGAGSGKRRAGRSCIYAHSERSELR